MAHEDASHGGTSHEHDGHKHEILSQNGQRHSQEGQSAMILPSLEGPHPWSDKPLLNDPDRFQIAIMTDRTGGHRPGVWMDAVRKVNLLRPEFVVSVGDLIEGYTDDRAQVMREWEEFLGFIDQMQMRFFFVAGNHDLTNPMMHEVWRNHFGPEWYSFDYRGVHFVCLSSEDPFQKISEKQLAWIREDLEKNRDARWTLVFLHKPLWTYAERSLERRGSDNTNWKQVEALLVDRPHTVFAGHVHHYVQYERNGQNYYSLATTGGGSSLRGNQYGEFDHVTWLTMEKEGPHVVNLRLDGILRPDVVTEESIDRLTTFVRNTTVEVAPILIDDANGFTEGELKLRLINEFGEHVEVEGTIDGLPLRGLTADPESIRLAVGPTGSAETAVRLRFSEQIEFESLRRATLTAKIRTTQSDPKGGTPLEVDRSIPIIIDRRYDCSLVEKPIDVDGLFDPAPSAWYATPPQPLILGEATSWKGPNDGSFELASSHDGEKLVFSVRITDEQVVSGEDAMRLILDARASDYRLDDSRLRWGSVRIRAKAPDQDGKVEVTARGGRDWDMVNLDVEAAAVRTDDGWNLEVSVPAKTLDWIQEENPQWDSFQMAAILEDVDEPGAQPSKVLWRGSNSVERQNTNYARFVRGE